MKQLSREVAREALANRASDFCPNGNCLEWTGAMHVRGYGMIRINDTKWMVHRLVWQVCHGDIPRDMVIAHRCNNKLCANPSHLYLASPRENAQDAARDGLRLKKLSKWDLVRITGLLRSVKPGTSLHYAHSLIGELFNVSYKTIEQLKTGVRYSSIDLSSAVRPRIDGRAEQYKVDPLVVEPNL